MDQTTLINHRINRSHIPPKYPATPPNITPIKREINTATKPMDNEIRDPTRSLLNKSLPYLSVPRGKLRSTTQRPSMLSARKGFGKRLKSTGLKSPLQLHATVFLRLYPENAKLE